MVWHLALKFSSEGKADLTTQHELWIKFYPRRQSFPRVNVWALWAKIYPLHGFNDEALHWCTGVRVFLLENCRWCCCLKNSERLICLWCLANSLWESVSLGLFSLKMNHSLWLQKGWLIVLFLWLIKQGSWVDIKNAAPFFYTGRCTNPAMDVHHFNFYFQKIYDRCWKIYMSQRL